MTVLLDQLPTPTGPAASGDGTFVLYSSRTNQTINKYYLSGPKKGTSEILMNLTGFPIKIKRATDFGSFWVSVNVLVQLQPIRLVHPFGYKFTSTGDILLQKNFTDHYGENQVNVVQEYYIGLLERSLYVGSRVTSYVGMFKTCGLL